jgi:serine/threonine-protein kinase PpkA
MDYPNIRGYRIENELAKGNWATLYLAVRKPLGPKVALKIIAPHYAKHRELIDLLLQEIRKIAKLAHPNLLTIYDFGISEKNPFIAMEYLSGGNLRKKIKEGLPPQKALKIISQVAAGLSCAHAKGILHHAIKPENILFREDGTAVVSDFSIMTSYLVTQPGSFWGFQPYKSPELIHGKGIGSRSDLFSLGVVFYEMLTGRLPFDAGSSTALAPMHYDPVPELPESLFAFQPLLDRLLEIHPSARYQSAIEVIAAIKRLESGKDIRTMQRE